MDFQLTLPHILRRVETYYPDKEIVSRLPDKSFHRYGYGEMARRAKQLAVALRGLGLEPGRPRRDAVWNHYAHLEAYWAIPCGGGVLHTLNLRLHPDDIAYIANHAGDRFLIVDDVLLPLLREVRGGDRLRARDRRRRDGTPSRRSSTTRSCSPTPTELDAARARRERRARRCATRRARPGGRRASSTATARSCCTRSRRRRPTRSAIGASATRSCRSCRCSTSTRGACRITARMVGAKHRDARVRTSTRRACSSSSSTSSVTVSCRRADDLDGHPRRRSTRARASWTLVAVHAHGRRRLGGARSADPRRSTASGCTMIHALGHDRDLAGRPESALPSASWPTRTRRTQLRAARASRACRCRSSRCARATTSGDVPWDGETMGELQVRGPWVAARYYDPPDAAPSAGPTTAGSAPATSSRSTPRGYVKITDRIKDLDQVRRRVDLARSSSRTRSWPTRRCRRRR